MRNRDRGAERRNANWARRSDLLPSWGVGAVEPVQLTGWALTSLSAIGDPPVPWLLARGLLPRVGCRSVPCPVAHGRSRLPRWARCCVRPALAAWNTALLAC